MAYKDQPSKIDYNNNCLGDRDDEKVPRGLNMAVKGARIQRLLDGHHPGPEIGLGAANIHDVSQDYPQEGEITFDYGFYGNQKLHP